MFTESSSELRCGHCHWSGPMESVSIELVNDGVGHRCPQCLQLIRVPDRLAPRRQSNDRFAPGTDALAGSPFRSLRIVRD